MAGEYDLGNPDDLAEVKAEVYRDGWNAFAKGQPIDNSDIKVGAGVVIDTAARNRLKVKRDDLTFVGQNGEPKRVGFVLGYVWSGPLDPQSIDPLLLWQECNLTPKEINQLIKGE